jgi:hypothetical protein
VAAHSLGKLEEALEAYRLLLENPKLPAEDGKRVEKNQPLCTSQLEGPSGTTSAHQPASSSS